MLGDWMNLTSWSGSQLSIMPRSTISSLSNIIQMLVGEWRIRILARNLMAVPIPWSWAQTGCKEP